MREEHKERHRGESERESERRKKQRFRTNLLTDQWARHATTPGYTDHHIQNQTGKKLKGRKRMREKNKERHRGEKERESERRKKQRFLTNLEADRRARHATTPGYTGHHIQTRRERN